MQKSKTRDVSARSPPRTANELVGHFNIEGAFFTWGGSDQLEGSEGSEGEGQSVDFEVDHDQPVR